MDMKTAKVNIKFIELLKEEYKDTYGLGSNCLLITCVLSKLYVTI
jgi:hypothetical protein